MNGEHRVVALCAALAVSRSGYYDWCASQTSARRVRDQVLLALIRAEHHNSGGTYGSPRVTRELHARDESVGHNRVARLMREAQLQGRPQKRYRACTTDSNHAEPIAPNLLASVQPSAPDQVWVGDITYIPTDEGWLYLAGVMDRFSRMLLGWAMGSHLDTTLPTAALQMALRRRQPAPGLLHHSDRGCQYASAAYRHILAEHGVIASMSRRGNCYDNAHMEAFWSTLKNELIYRHRFPTRAAARTAIFAYIEGFYNRSRRHSALGYQSPLDYEANLTTLKN